MLRPCCQAAWEAPGGLGDGQAVLGGDEPWLCSEDHPAVRMVDGRARALDDVCEPMRFSRIGVLDHLQRARGLLVFRRIEMCCRCPDDPMQGLKWLWSHALGDTELPVVHSAVSALRS